MKKLLLVMTMVFVVQTGVFGAEITQCEVSFIETSAVVSGMIEGFCPKVLLRVISPALIETVFVDEVHTVRTEEGYSFAFDPFHLSQDLPSGNYIIQISGNSIEQQEIVRYYLNKQEMKEILNDIDQKQADEIVDVLLENGESLNIDVLALKTLDEEWQRLIAEQIGNLELAVETDEEVSDKLSLLQQKFREYLHVSKILSAEDEDTLEELIIQDEIAFDRKFETLITTELLSRYMLSYPREEVDESVDGVTRLYDCASLLATLAECDWDTGKQSLLYYDEKGLVTLDKTYYTRLEYEETATLFKELKNESFATVTDIPDAFLRLSKAIGEEDSGAGLSGSGGSGGGGSGGGKKSEQIYTESESNDEPVISNKFTDLAGYEWAAQSIAVLSDRGIITGREATKFFPGEYVTREEFIKMLVLSFDYYDPQARIEGFTDVLESNWSYSYIASGIRNGLIVGKSSTEFGGEEMITRQDMAVMMYRVAQKTGVGESEGALFPDDDFISPYAKDAVAKLRGAGILNGDSNGMFRPLDYMTRAEGAKIIHSLMVYIGKA